MQRRPTSRSPTILTSVQTLQFLGFLAGQRQRHLRRPRFAREQKNLVAGAKGYIYTAETVAESVSGTDE